MQLPDPSSTARPSRPQRYAALLALLCLPLSGQATEPQWHPFEWQSASVVAGGPIERVALFIPAKINGIDCKLQLDTGANGGVLWHDGRVAEGAATVSVLVEAGGASMTATAGAGTAARIKSGACDGIASLGNAFFEHGTLTLNLDLSKYSYASSALLVNNSAAQPLIYSQWSEAGGHTLVEVRLSSGLLGYALLDTGSARFGLSAIDAAEWHAITGGLPLAASTTVTEFQVNSWGKQVSCYETIVKRPLTIADMLTLKEYMASYCAVDRFKPGQKLVGLLGLRHLGRRTITLDYLSRRWLLR